jgi:hypothetical protein
MLVNERPVVEATDPDEAIVKGESPPAGRSGCVGRNVSLNAGGQGFQVHKGDARVLKDTSVGHVFEQGMLIAWPERTKTDLSKVKNWRIRLLFDE